MKPLDRAGLVALAAGFLFSAVMAFSSDGVYHDDDLTHFLFARWAAWFPEYLLHAWGRPGLTIPLATVAWMGDAPTGWLCTRLLSAVVTAGSAVVAVGLVRRLRPAIGGAWVVALCYLQPLAAVLSYTTLTENFAGLYGVAACAFMQRGRLATASAFFSLLLVTRHEAIALLPIWGLLLLVQTSPGPRKALALAACLWAPFVYNVLFRFVYGVWPVSLYTEATGSTEYPAIGWLGYVPPALQAISPTIAGLALIGGAALLARRQWALPAFAGSYFLIHAALKAMGLYASGGYGRFMVVVSPLVAVLAAIGLDRIRRTIREPSRSRQDALLLACPWWIGVLALQLEITSGRLDWLRGRWGLAIVCIGVIVGSLVCLAGWLEALHRRRAARAGMGALLIGTCLVQWAWIVRPLRLAPEHHCARQICDWLQANELGASPLFYTHPWIAYFENLVEKPRAHKNAALLASMPVGTVVIWDSAYSGSDFHRLSLEELRGDDHYRHLASFNAGGPRRMVFELFRKTAPTPQPAVVPPSFPRNLAAEKSPVRGMYYLRPQR